jgi:hypothetical protein
MKKYTILKLNCTVSSFALQILNTSNLLTMSVLIFFQSVEFVELSVLFQKFVTTCGFIGRVIRQASVS